LKTRFKIRFAPSFHRRTRALDKEVQIRILREVDILKTNPYAGKPLRGEMRGVYSLRVGDYRILYNIKGNEVFLLLVGHRKRIYE